MEDSTCYVIPAYTRDHHEYYKQVFEWYVRSNHCKEELRDFYLDPTKQFEMWKVKKSNHTPASTSPVG